MLPPNPRACETPRQRLPPATLQTCLESDGVLLARSESAPNQPFGPGEAGFSDQVLNGETWQVGLRDYADAIDAAGGKLTLVVTPLRRGVRVKVTSSMAARLEQSDACVADVTDVYATPVYHMPVGE